MKYLSYKEIRRIRERVDGISEDEVFGTWGLYIGVELLMPRKSMRLWKAYVRAKDREQFNNRDRDFAFNWFGIPKDA